MLIYLAARRVPPPRRREASSVWARLKPNESGLPGGRWSSAPVTDWGAEVGGRSWVSHPLT